MPHGEVDSLKTGRRRERSARYPGATLFDAIDLTREMSQRGVDGLPSASVAAAMGYKNIKTQTFSARLSAARQYGLITLRDGGYALTELARSILHPIDPGRLPSLHRTAFLHPSLNAELCEKLEGRKVPDSPALANWLYHNHQITAAAKDAAAEVFLSTARELRVLGDDGFLRVGVALPAVADETLSAAPVEDPTRIVQTSRLVNSSSSSPVSMKSPQPAPVHVGESRVPSEPLVQGGDLISFDLRLWGRDEGKLIRLSAPESITRASLERFLKTFELMVRVEED